MDGDILKENAKDLVGAVRFERSTKKPSEWAEENRVMREGTPFKGPFSYDRTPYLREIVDRLTSEDEKKVISVMKGAQIGFSTGVIENGIAWGISEAPSNMMLLSGHGDLSEEMMNKIDGVIDNTGIRDLIRPSAVKKKRSGDTQKMKEFPGGSLIVGSAGNHKLLRQRAVQVMFVDDFDAVKVEDKSSGSTRKMIEQRLAAYYGKMKLFYISTPEVKGSSNIEQVYEMGDRRKFYVPCPLCGDLITLEWEARINETEKGGIYWELDKHGKLISDSVGYRCQSCGDIFDESHKMEMLRNGEWRPTVEPQRSDYTSYHLSSLYAPSGMYDWLHYVDDYLEANPPGGDQNESLHKTFVNLCLGEPWEDPGKTPRANDIQKNTRDYEVGTVPETLSRRDGNGDIVMLTCAADLNGKVDDARLDWEIVAWSESGSSYSIDHGSIGTFVPKEDENRYKEGRKRYSYQASKPNSVWNDFEDIVRSSYSTDTGRNLPVIMAGIDAPSHFAAQAYDFIGRTDTNCVALKGESEDQFVSLEKDTPTFRKSKDRADLYLVQVNNIKDKISAFMKMSFDPHNDERQPAGFMNFPEPTGGKYDYRNFFSHYESEIRRVRNNRSGNPVMRWEKVASNVQNHMWDVRVYNMAIRDIAVHGFMTAMKFSGYDWNEFVSIIKQK